MIIDTHAHFSKPDAASPAELPDAMAKAVARSVPAGHTWETPEQLLAQLEAAGIDKLIQVTPSIMGFDNSYSLQVAGLHEDHIRVVAHLDAERESELPSEIARVAADPLAVGIRLLFVDESARGADLRLAQGFDAATELSVPTCIYAPCVPRMVVEVAKRWPSLSIVVDHAGLDVLPHTDPDRRTAEWPIIMELADCANVVLKISGLPEVAPSDEVYPFPTAQALLGRMIEHFGSERLMWGSNYPPVARRCSLSESLDWVDRDCSFLNSAQREDLLWRTAVRVFDLPWATTAAPAELSRDA